MNFAGMQERVYLQLRDYPKEFVEDNFVEKWLNEAQRDIAQRTKILTKEISGVTAAGGFALPADFVDSLYTEVAGSPVNFDITDDGFWALKRDGVYSTTTYGRLFADRVEAFPTPADGAVYSMRYAYLPPDLVNDADESPFPSELEDKMVLFATSRALTLEREPALADTYRTEYEVGLPERTLAFGRKYPTPTTLGFHKTQFDLDPQARHIG